MSDSEKKENLDKEKSQEKETTQKQTDPPKFSWKFCPQCGSSIPTVSNLKYCTKCGLDLIYLREHKTLPPSKMVPSILENKSFQSPIGSSIIPPSPLTSVNLPISPIIEQPIKQDIEIDWNACPRCGFNLPKIKNQRFCLKCGLDLIYVKQNKALPPIQSTTQSPWYPPPQPYPAYMPPGRALIEKVSDENINNYPKKKLWSSFASIGIPLLSFIVMNVLVMAVFIVFFLFIPNETALTNLISNPYFLVLSSLFEFILILFPLLYVGKYIENPNLKNRLAFLGFTAKGYDSVKKRKEVLIGLAFAGIGIVLVGITSIITQLFIELVFGVEFISEETSDVDLYISAADVIAIIFIVISMLLIVGVCEETLFRGFMMRGLTRSLGDSEGLYITAFIFAIIHLVAYMLYMILGLLVGDIMLFYEGLFLFLLSFPPYLAVSLMLGWLYRWRKENLIAVVVTHGVYNSLTIILAYLFLFFY